MAKRGYKLQEFVAHSSNVNCLNIGKKACRLLISGGDDHKVNVWAIGKPNSLMSLHGHTSPVESLAFDSAEVLVLGGSTSGVIKLWDLEEAKMVRTLSGHRSNCSAVEFHPFGEFFASGSMDTNLKLWDIKKKGCIHTYKGHTQGISTIKFTPDGRWVVSGGFDNVVKVWDLTAGKLLHEFKFHDGHIRSLDFHPLEFLLATGSADRTVKFWDLETFELIGSTRPEATGVCAMTFHPDGRTLFTGLEDNLKVYSWEPVICHDAIDMGWSTLGDLCMHDGKLIGCSFYQNSVGVWVADTSLIEPYGVCPEQDLKEQKPNLNLKSSQSLENIRSGMRNLGLRCTSPDSETKEIKNIYVDTTGGKPAPQKTDSLGSTKGGLPLDSKEMHDFPSPKPSPTKRVKAKSTEQALDQSFAAQVIVPRESPDGKDSANNGRESVSFSKTKRGMLLRPAHIRRPSNSKIDLEKSPPPVDSGIFRSPISDLDRAPDPSFRTRVISDEGANDSFDEKHSNIRSISKKFDKVLPPQTPSDRGNCNESVDHSKVISPVKFVNGVAVVTGRTRTLVERFERREPVNINEVQATNSSPQVPESDKIATLQKTEPQKVEPQEVELQTVEPQRVEPQKAEPQKFEQQKFEPKRFEPKKVEPQKVEPKRVEPQKAERPLVPLREIATPANDMDVTEFLIESHDVLLSSLRSRLTKLQVVRHFWERNDMKGAINAMTKLPDQSVQADVISVLIDKMDVLTLDLFSCLLPVLVGLLNSKTERHSSLSMEMLLKLIAVFGPVIHSSVSAPPVVGVDLHAEQRRQCCDQCFVQLQSVQKILPSLVRRGGVLARSAQELNLLLQTL